MLTDEEHGEEEGGRLCEMQRERRILFIRQDIWPLYADTSSHDTPEIGSSTVSYSIWHLDLSLSSSCNFGPHCTAVLALFGRCPFSRAL